MRIRKIQKTVQFLRACYESDNREAAIGNLLGKSIRHITFFTQEDYLLGGTLNRVPIDRTTAESVSKEAQLYRREKSLLYCAFPIVGRPTRERTRLPKVLCAPLLFYSAKILHEDAASYLEVDLDTQRINLPILSSLLDEAKTAGSILDELASQFPRPPFRKENVLELISLLHDFVPHMDAFAMAQFPLLQTESDVRASVRKARSRSETFHALSATALALVPNSPETRGVLFELAEIEKGGVYSAPLRVVLGEKPPPPRRLKWNARRSLVPAVLSRSQQNILASAAVAPLTLIVGPPGTGKSFTIAATAVDQLSRGESVLIACRKPQALNVIAGMVERLLGPNQCVIRGEEGHHQRQLKSFLEQILQGIRSRMGREEDRLGDTPRAIDRELVRVRKRHAALERDLTKHLKQEVQWGRFATDGNGNWLQRMLRDWRKGNLSRRLAKRPAVWRRVLDYERSLREWNDLIRRLLVNRIQASVDVSLQKHRRDLTTFLQSLRARSSTRQQALFSEIDPRVLFEAFPIWLTTIADASKIVPLETEVFDLVIFDEATQCDIASCLPALQRAKRCLVAGDPNQLRHISFLADDRQRRLARHYGLDEAQQQRCHYRQTSFLDLVNESIATQDHVHFLDEHFRSMPQIIQFSNRHFYNSALSIMRLKPRTAMQQCVFPVSVTGGRKQGGANPKEAEALIEALERQVRDQASLTRSVCQSMGVLSPFRDQVDLISRLLEKRLTLADFQRHALQVGTAHAFQGDERDVMFLSWCIDADTHPASRRFLDQPNLFNVAITRARHKQFVFHSIRPDQLPGESLLRKYLESLQQDPSHPSSFASAEKDAFLEDVKEELKQRGCRSWCAYALAGVHIDLVVERAGHTLGIDLMGYPGPYLEAVDLERYRILQRAGFSLFPLPYSRWCSCRQECLEAIDAML